jgi:hypothetical protein
LKQGRQGAVAAPRFCSYFLDRFGWFSTVSLQSVADFPEGMPAANHDAHGSASGDRSGSGGGRCRQARAADAQPARADGHGKIHSLAPGVATSCHYEPEADASDRDRDNQEARHVLRGGAEAILSISTPGITSTRTVRSRWKRFGDRSGNGGGRQIPRPSGSYLQNLRCKTRMVWGKTWDEYYRGARWFAWRPVRLENGQFAWLEWVWRLPCSHDYCLWNYSLEKPIPFIPAHL